MHRRHAIGAVAAILSLAVGPSALAAQEDPPDPWAASSFVLADDKADIQSSEEIVTIAGSLVYEKGGTGETITDAVVRIEPDPEADPPIPLDCPIPDEATLSAPTPNPEASESTVEFSLQFVLRCNGPYVATAEATASTGSTHSMTVDVGVSVPPGPVTALTAAERGGGAIDIAWSPPEPKPLDIVGYSVERAGPSSTTAFEPISGNITVREWTDTITQNGTYVYRVRAIRRAASGTITGAPKKAATATVDASSAPTTTTTTTAPQFTAGTGPIPTVPPPRPTPSLPPPPTTIDPGFENELDYGDRPAVSLGTPSTAPLPDDDEDEFAGSSIIVTEETTTDVKAIAASAAGAAVLVVWAGHLVYVNRLASRLDLEEVVVDSES